MAVVATRNQPFLIHAVACHTLRLQVFFIRDGMQFPDLVHCLRPNPKSNIQEAWRILDFLSFHPESVNIVSSHTGREAKD